MESTRSRRRGLTTPELLRTFLPLSSSDMIMVLAGPIVGVVLGRLPDVGVNLAAYGVALSMAILLESPIIMMLHAGTAAAPSPTAYRALGALMGLWTGLITILYALIAFTPAYTWVAEVALGLPADIAGAARPAFAILLLWPAAIAVRRYMQGQLIYHKRSRDVMIGGLARLSALVITLLIAAAAGLPGASAAALASLASVGAEAAATGLFIWRLRQRILSGLVPAKADSSAYGLPSQLGPLFWWYLPLAGTQVLVWLARPLITGGIARAGLAALSLAAWPIAWSSVNVLANGTRMIQQLTIGMVNDRESFLSMRRFAVLIGLGFSGLLAAIGWTPLAGVFLERVIGMPADLAAVSRPVLALSVALPLQVSLQNWMQGLLVQSGRTGLVNAGAFFGGVITVAAVYLGAMRWQLPGAALAAGASILGLTVELVFLWWVSAPARRRYELDLESLAGRALQG